MGYDIKTISLNEFIKKETKLPRFQRKTTWKPKDNMEFCISIFSRYPVGNLITNTNKDGCWLIDGRQRKNVIDVLKYDPVKLCNWALSYFHILSTDNDTEIDDKFYGKINTYINKIDNIDDQDEPEETDDYGNQDEIVPKDCNNKDPFKGKDYKCLLTLIKYIHPINRGNINSAFSCNELNNRLPYYDQQRKKIKIREVSKFIIDYTTECKKNEKMVNIDSYIEYIDRQTGGFNIEEKEKIRDLVKKKWDEIKIFIDFQIKKEKILDEEKIGYINVNNASDIDVQNIFSLINRAGAKLTAEELLSAKKYWNKNIEIENEKLQEKVKELYAKLDVNNDDKIVRWDLCATFIDVIDENGYIFEKNNNNIATRIALGFRLMSAIIIGGIDSNSVCKLENPSSNGLWDSHYDELCSDLKFIIDNIIQENEYFRCMNKWKQSIMGLTSNTIALEFISVMHKRWNYYNKPDEREKKKINILRKEAIVLFDKLIFEYSSMLWRGSSDSTLRNHLKEVDNRFKCIENDDWKNLIADLAKGKIREKEVKQDNSKPILFHTKFLRNEEAPNVNKKFHIDHIYPQDKFNANEYIKKYNKDSIINLEILSDKSNTKKSNTPLNKIEDDDVKKEITRSSGIEEKDFEKYSDIQNWDDLKDLRLKQLEESLYNTKRNDRMSVIQN